MQKSLFIHSIHESCPSIYNSQDSFFHLHIFIYRIYIIWAMPILYNSHNYILHILFLHIESHSMSFFFKKSFVYLHISLFRKYYRYPSHKTITFYYLSFMRYKSYKITLYTWYMRVDQKKHILKLTLTSLYPDCAWDNSFIKEFLTLTFMHLFTQD